MAEQLSLFDLLEAGQPKRDPFNCPYELKRWSDKTCCTYKGREIWTNCRAHSLCLWEREHANLAHID